MNRRSFLTASAGISGIVLSAGCTEESDTQQSDELSEQPEQSEPTDTHESAEVENIEYNLSGVDGIEFTIETSTGRFEDKRDFVVQTFPHYLLSPEREFDESEVTTIKRETEIDLNNSKQFLITPETDIDNHIGVDSYPFGIQAKIQKTEENDSGETTRKTEEMLQLSRGFQAFTNKEGNIEIGTRINNQSWVEDGMRHIKVVTMLPFSQTNVYDTDSNFAAPVVFEHSLPEDEFQALVDLHNSDPVAWDELTATRTHDKLGTVVYKDRPIIKEFAKKIEDTMQLYGLTDDDDLYMNAVFNLASTRYNQNWDEVSTRIGVPYPEIVLEQYEGDCKAQGFLANSLFHHLGYDTSLTSYYEEWGRAYHLAGGVEFDPETSLIAEDVKEQGLETTPVTSRTNEKAEDHLVVDPSFNKFGYSPLEDGELVAANEFLPGKEE